MVPPLLLASVTQYFFGILLFLTATFLILLVLVQRGRGGGLAGAFGGMGGQSAFGTKAGDLFTKITVVAAAVWIALCVTTIVVLNRQSRGLLGDPGAAPPSVGAEAGEGAETGEDAGTEGEETTGGQAGDTTPPATETGGADDAPADTEPADAADSGS